MTKELNFKNLTIKYDGESFSKSIMRKVKIIEGIGIFLNVIVLFSVMRFGSIFLDIENHLGLSIIINLLLIGLVVGGGIALLTFICKKVSPRHYEFVTWLMRYKSNEIEIGWLNDRYVVNMYGQHGWIKREFGNFIDEDYKFEDKAEKSKPVHMTIDLVNGDVEVVVENQ